MRTLAVVVTATVVGIASQALAVHPDPGPRAKRIVADLVMAYEPCTTPDAATDTFNYDACSAPVRSDPTCGFGPDGKGTLKIASTPKNLRVTFNLRGLTAGCEGSFMGVVLHWRATGDDCSGATCTLTDNFDPGWGACQVTGGKCVLPLAGGTFAFLPVGARTGVELRGADIVRENTFRPFAMGFVLP